MPTFYRSQATSPSGRVRSAQVNQAFNQENSQSVEVYGTSVPGGFTLSLYKDGALLATEGYALHDPQESGGYDVRLKDYRGATSTPRDLGQHSAPSAGLENVPTGTSATLDDFFGTVSLADPNAGVSTETQARTALASAGISLVVIDGPGVWHEPMDNPNAVFEDTSTEDFLQATLLKTGARWWLEGTVLTIDGSAAPSVFTLPEADKHLITSYSYSDESPELEPPEETDPPDREDYLSQCPDYEPPEGYEPPERTPERVLQGVFRYPSHAGSGDDRVDYERVNYYNGRLFKTELTERGTINTPTGKTYGTRSYSVTTFDHHPMCKEAVTREHTLTYATPSMNDAGEGSEVEDAVATWQAMGAGTPYLQSETTIERFFHSSGYLKEETEVIRELDVLSLKQGTDGPTDFRFVYNTRTRQLINEPNAGGRWVQYVNERQTENVVVYERGEMDPVTGKETAGPARVQRNSRATSRAEPTDAAPSQLTCSPPEPDDPDAPPEDAPCEEKKDYEYEKALAAWAAAEALKQAEYASRLANIANQPRRVHNVTLGIPRPDIKLNTLYGGGLVAACNVSYQDDGSTVGGTTSLTVWQKL